MANMIRAGKLVIGLKIERYKHPSLLQHIEKFYMYNVIGLHKLQKAKSFQVLHSRVGSWPYSQTLDKAGKACRERKHYVDKNISPKNLLINVLNSVQTFIV